MEYTPVPVNRLAPLILCLLFLGGCAVSDPPEFTVAPGKYAAAFDAAREVLRDYRFRLERVDADAGVMTTQRKASSGLATLWDMEQTHFDQEFEEFLNQQRRAVIVTFVGPDPDSAVPLTEEQGKIRARVEVIIYQVQSPGLRPASKSIAMSTLTVDPVEAARGAWGTYEVPVSQDTALASRLAKEIRRRHERAD